MRLLTITAAVALVSGCALQASQGSPFRWSGKVEAGKAITIKNVNGSIHAEHANGNEVEVVAVRSSHRSNPDDVKIYVNPTGDGYTVCAIYPGGGRDCQSTTSNTHNNDTQVEFTVRVPSGVRFNGHTVNGSVVGQGLRDDVDAATVNGRVDVSSLGSVSAATVNGNIQVVMGRVNWLNSRKLHTVSGSIDVDLPASASAEVRASTVNGGITCEFPLTVQGGFTGKSVKGTIGGGGRELQLTTVNGSIHLKKHSGGAI